ncbi:ficolin-2-like [Diadema antillarum]|uniref:ficolin-2-like n=2 Tax=Diadema antillarum TaxID=105358 RepID=UPI003A86ED2F
MSESLLNTVGHKVIYSSLDGFLPRDCADVQESGRNVSGRYAIYPDDCEDPFFVYCDMDTDRGGWTIFHRRLDGGEDFDRGWADYKYGFGSVVNEHWLGNERVYRIVRQKLYQLRVDLEDFDGERRHAEYLTIRLGNEHQNYVIKLGPYSGDAGNGLLSHNKRPFTTKDRDNDGHDGNCAQTYHGGWWYFSCHTVSLNGIFLAGSHDFGSHGVVWSPWRGQNYSLKRAEMKLRPLSARARFND